MSKNSQTSAPKSRVLNTSALRTILKSVLICAVIGALIGIGIMVKSVFETRLAADPADMVVTLAANEAADPQQINTDGVVFNGLNSEYDGRSHSVTIDETTLPEGVSYKLFNQTHTNAGTYTVTAIFFGDGFVTKTVDKEMVIAKATIDLSKVTFADETKQYNGSKQNIGQVKGLPSGVKVEYIGNGVKEVGTHKVIAVIYGDNHVTAYLEATLTITKADIDPSKITFYGNKDGATNFYNGSAYGFTFAAGTIPADASYRFLDPDALDADGNPTEIAALPTITLPGTKDVILEVYGDCYNTVRISATLSVAKSSDMIKGEGIVFDDLKTDFNDAEDAAAVNIECSKLPSDIEATYTYYKLVNGVETLIDKSEVIDSGSYVVKVSLHDTLGRYDDATDEASIEIMPLDIEKRFNISLDDDDATYGFSGKNKLKDHSLEARGIYALPEGIKLVYQHIDANGNVIKTSSDPISFTNAGVYTIRLAVAEGSDPNYILYEEITATLTIKKLDLSRYVSYGKNDIFGVVNADLEQTFSGNGAKHMPEAWIDTSYLPSIPGVPEPVLTLKFFIGDEEITDGLTQPDLYNVRMVVEGDNYFYEEYISVRINYNMIIVLYAILAALPVGLIIGVVTVFVGSGRDKASQHHFQVPRAGVERARGRIICESRAKFKNKKRNGRLYLTAQTVEFYAEDYRSTDNNFLLKLDDIRSVDAVTASKIVIYANREEYVFSVPAGTADDWRYQISKA